jgi:hypothetical protein
MCLARHVLGAMFRHSDLFGMAQSGMDRDRMPAVHRPGCPALHCHRRRFLPLHLHPDYSSVLAIVCVSRGSQSQIDVWLYAVFAMSSRAVMSCRRCGSVRRGSTPVIRLGGVCALVMREPGPRSRSWRRIVGAVLEGVAAAVGTPLWWL